MKPQNEISLPNGGRQPPMETPTSTKNYTMTRTTNDSYLFGKHSTATGSDAP